VNKYGEGGARMLASLQKMMLLIEGGVWNPEDGDPLELISLSQSFEGNRDYQNCVLEKGSSPWIFEYENAS
jgi:hypothetical protein